MKMKIDKKTAPLIGIVLVLLVAIGILLGRSDSSTMNSDHMSGAMSQSDSANSAITGADIMFLQMMIPHHQQAIDISNLAMKKSKNSELLALAKKISSAQTAEIITMQNWLTDAGAGMDMGHSSHDMGGMLSSEDLTKLKTLSGSAFDKFWLEGMVGHHNGAIHMTQMINDAQNVEIRDFGLKIVADQSAQIELMKAMSERL